jgi:hypothetical protein
MDSLVFEHNETKGCVTKSFDGIVDHDDSLNIRCFFECYLEVNNFGSEFVTNRFGGDKVKQELYGGLFSTGRPNIHTGAHERTLANSHRLRDVGPTKRVQSSKKLYFDENEWPVIKQVWREMAKEIPGYPSITCPLPIISI